MSRSVLLCRGFQTRWRAPPHRGDKPLQVDVLAELRGLYDAVYNDGADDGFSVEEINH